ncbi:MAG: aromatic amino acid transporter [Burkholderiales bacterium]|jgi:amino acid permease|nr:aromatic amino acid transporter [Burkholderiales bacterium]
MTNVSLNRQIGAILMIVGTEVGAGILALPILVAHFGFIPGFIMLVVMWLIMTYTTFVICDLNLLMPPGSSFARMSNNVFGFIGRAIVWICFLLILYPILVAYISASGSSFNEILHVSDAKASTLFVIILGIFVLWGTSKVDFINRILLGTKLGLLVFICIALTFHANGSFLLAIKKINIKFLMITLPVFVTSFVGHIIIPTLRVYLNSDTKVLKRVIWIGCAIPFIFYLIWLIAIMGSIPPGGPNSFATIAALGDKANVGDILHLLRLNLTGTYFVTPILAFTTISVSTSFLAVSTSLKDFLIDGLNLNKFNKLLKFILVLLLVFVLPLVISLSFADIFIRALSFVGLSCTILLIVIPMVMVFKLKAKRHKFNFYLTDNIVLNLLVFIYGMLLLSEQVIVPFI